MKFLKLRSSTQRPLLRSRGDKCDRYDLSVTSAIYKLNKAIIQIENEILRVEEIYRNDLEVSRGQLSTVAAAHSNGSTVTHAACLLNGTLNAVAQSLTLTSTAALGVVQGDTLKISDEVLRVESVTGNRLSVTRGVNDNTGTALRLPPC